jgi:hypothetical protein
MTIGAPQTWHLYSVITGLAFSPLIGRVLALLRVVLAGEERPEESAARFELAAALGAAQLVDLRQVVRFGDQ